MTIIPLLHHRSYIGLRAHSDQCSSAWIFSTLDFSRIFSWSLSLALLSYLVILENSDHAKNRLRVMRILRSTAFGFRQTFSQFASTSRFNYFQHYQPPSAKMPTVTSNNKSKAPADKGANQPSGQGGAAKKAPAQAPKGGAAKGMKK